MRSSTVFKEEKDGDQACLRDALNDLIDLTTQYVRYNNCELGDGALIDAKRALTKFDEEQRKKQS